MSYIKERIRSNFIGEMIINKLHEIEGVILPKIISDEKAVRKYYFNGTGKELNLENPVTFCEKLNWYKLKVHDPLMVQCADKIGVREYAAEKGYGENVNKVYGIYSDVKDIDISKLPDRFVIKAAHGTHMQIIVNDKSAINWKQAKMEMKSWLKQDIYWRGREWVYKDMPKRIIIEKYLEDETGELRDYKFFCFHGKPYYLQYDIGRFAKQQYRNYYDMNGTLLQISDGTPNLPTEPFPLDDETFQKMKLIAENLSSSFQQVRVDFYCCNRKIYIGEMTFYDGGGSTLFTPNEWNTKFSENWEVCSISPNRD